MDTLIIRKTEELPEAAKALSRGGMAAVPTETVYGLCVNGLDADAVHRLYEVKGRPEVKPLSLMVPDVDELQKYTVDPPRAAFTLAEWFWPGPLTIVLKAGDAVPPITRADRPTVGLRCPDHPMALALLASLSFPLAGPSANPSGQPSPKTAEEVLAYFDGKIDAVIDGGPCGIGTESTVLDLSAVPFRILRQGALSRDAIQAALRNGLKVIGVTGGTGSGKTTVIRLLEKKGALALDCDQIYHELLERSEPMLRELRERFPDAFFDGKLDRKALGAAVFASPEELAALNAVTHRYVGREVSRRLDEFAWRGGTTAAVDAIALFESGLADECSLTVGVLAPEELRLRRIMAREGIDEEYAMARIRAQRPDDFFRERCDRVLVNDSTPEALEKQCEILFGI